MLCFIKQEGFEGNKRNKIILEGKLNHIDALWDMPVYSPPDKPSFMLPTTHPGLYESRNKKSYVISSNTPKRLSSHKSKNIKGYLESTINEKIQTTQSKSQ